MERSTIFVFESSRLDRAGQEATLTYRLGEGLRLTERVLFPEAWPPEAEAGAAARALQALHLLGGTSYYKTCCPPRIAVAGEGLSAGQAAFFERVYERGLGEFFYRNRIDFRGLIRFPAERAEPAPPQEEPPAAPRRALVPIGGGKDSVVAAELARAAGLEVTLFRVGRHPLIDRAAAAADLPLLVLERRLAPELFELNRRGALNGHVPITAYVSALAVLTALLYGFDTVLFANERSASEGNLRYLGVEINHQWSKGLEFERLFQGYLRRYVSGRVRYASLLRPLGELRIAEEFCRHPRYFACATSCNANWRILERPAPSGEAAPRWCGACPKCAFSFALFAAFLPVPTLESIFGANLFGREELLPLYRQLLGLEGTKPFECVGTAEETAAAFLLAARRGELDATPAMRLFRGEALPRLADPEGLVAAALAPSPEHALPDELAALLPERLVPRPASAARPPQAPPRRGKDSGGSAGRRKAPPGALR